jgi:hypothetical protein
MTAPNNGGVLPSATRQRLENLHRALLRLHKVLLDEERAAYDKVHGRTPAGQMLQLVISNPQFAWLRRISELIVQIDELLESDHATASAGAADLMRQMRLLLAPGDATDEFARKYQDALQRQPDAVLAHKEVTAILSRDDH